MFRLKTESAEVYTPALPLRLVNGLGLGQFTWKAQIWWKTSGSPLGRGW